MKFRVALAGLAALAGAIIATQATDAAPAASASSTASIPKALQFFYTQELSWTPCREKLECASYEVPLD